MRAERLYVRCCCPSGERGEEDKKGGRPIRRRRLYKYILHFHFKDPFSSSSFFLIFFTAPKDLTTHFATTRALEGFPSTAHWDGEDYGKSKERENERPFLFYISPPTSKKRKIFKWAIHRPSGKKSKRSKGQKSAQREQVDKFLPQPIGGGGDDDCDTQFMIVPPPRPPPTSNDYTYIWVCIYLAPEWRDQPATQTGKRIHSFHCGRHNREKGGTRVVATHVRLNWI